MKLNFVIGIFAMDISGNYREFRMWEREEAGEMLPL